MCVAGNAAESEGERLGDPGTAEEERSRLWVLITNEILKGSFESERASASSPAAAAFLPRQILPLLTVQAVAARGVGGQLRKI